MTSNVIPMDPLAAWFPYPAYRPHQKEMLDAAVTVARRGGILMIDAPTGSGKSAVVAALLSEARDRRVVVAVRTKSQLATFLRELSLVRKKQPDLRYAYLIGKGQMCLLGKTGDVYRRCEGVKALSTALMRDRAEAGSLVPAKDRLIRQQIRRMDPENPLICPYFIHGRSFAAEEGEALRMIPSALLRAKADRVLRESVVPEALPPLAGECCPYEVMLQAARSADVVLLNFHHVLDDAIREQLYLQLGAEPQEILLLIDEAHNCGDAVQSIQSVVLSEKDIEAATHEIHPLRGKIREAEAVLPVLPRIRAFMGMLQGAREPEDWFDPAIFDRTVVQGSLYASMEAIVDDILVLSDAVRERSMATGEFRESAVERLTGFLYRIHQSASDPAFLTLFRREEEEVMLEVRSIDPSAHLTEIAGTHAACVMISGTLSPVDSFRRLYFGDLPVTTLSLPNAFPKKNRRIYLARDVSTAYRLREDRQVTARIEGYIRAFCTLPGNLAIYFPSYQILSQYADRCDDALNSKEVFVEPREAQDAGAALRTFLSLPSRGRSGVLFAVAGGKWSEGLDYRGEFLSGAMVVGLPLAPYNRVREMVIQYFRRKFGDEGEFLSYTLPAVNRALQALGRVIRTPEDRGVLVLAEQRFLEPNVKAALPAWMQEEAVTMTLEEFRKDVTAWR
jgi:DNA excision repair protein ERCC-2